MTEVEMLQEMISLQAEYDQMVFAAHGISGYEEIRSKIDYALLDEIGEFNHEMKASWCWWKKTQKPTDRKKALEEYVDMTHFIIMQALACGFENVLREEFESSFSVDEPEGIASWTVFDFLEPTGIYGGKALRLVALANGFAWPEVYEAYKAKNQINRQRIAEGY